MAWIPTFKLYASDGVTLIYTFEHIQTTNWPIDNPSSVDLVNTRASGAITIPMGEQPYDINLQGVLIADDYTALTSKMFTLKNTIVANTRYVLKLDKTNSSVDTIKVMRKQGISFPTGRRTTVQQYTCILQALSWA